MGIREKFKESPSVAAAAAAVFVLAAAAIIAHAYWPEKKADLSQAYYSDDDGQTWFVDSIYKVAPFDHNGKTALIAEVYSYDDGKQKFCAYLSQFTPEGKKQMDAALSDAEKKGLPPDSVPLYQDRNFMNRSVEVKLSGPNHPWILYGDPKAQEVFTIHSPDGSAVDQVLVY
jgi:hypothetical protein